MFIWPIPFLLVCSLFQHDVQAALERFKIRVPSYRSTVDDEYVAITVKPPAGYIIGFEPHATADHVHHIMLAGCEEPFHPAGLSGGGMTCKGRERYLYSWAKNAGNLSFPQGVSYKVGHEEDKIKYLVMIVHYANRMTGDYTDHSGLTLLISKEPTKYSAVEYLFVSGDKIPSGHQNYKVNVSCRYESDTKAVPFYYRVHTHDHGKLVSAHIVDSNKKFHFVGKRNPLWPQSFEKVEKPVTVQKGDILAAQCIYDTTGEKKPLRMGMTNSHEMCNFQIVFYYPAGEPDPFPENSACYDTVLDNLEIPYPDVKLLPHNQTLLDMAKSMEGHEHHHEHGKGDHGSLHPMISLKNWDGIS